jgi:cytidyltransferase-like protein
MKVGITFSTFDLLHAGHVKMLEEAKRQCDYLIVGLQLDPFESIVQRKMRLHSRLLNVIFS